jgi:hypothetical protein
LRQPPLRSLDHMPRGLDLLLAALLGSVIAFLLVPLACCLRRVAGHYVRSRRHDSPQPCQQRIGAEQRFDGFNPYPGLSRICSDIPIPQSSRIRSCTFGAAAAFDSCAPIMRQGVEVHEPGKE